MKLGNIFKKEYRALGFVEALIAIIIAGITSVLLMGVAVDTIAQVTKSDQQDEMTQLAVEGGEMVKNIAEKNSISEELLFPNISGNQGSCFELNLETDDPSFVSGLQGEYNPKCSYDSGNRENCVNNSNLSNQGYFRVMCITNESDINSGLVVAKIVVGKTKCNDSQSCDIPDYEYYVLTKTVQK